MSYGWISWQLIKICVRSICIFVSVKPYFSHFLDLPPFLLKLISVNIKDEYILCHWDWVRYSYMTHHHQPNKNKSHQFIYQLILQKWSSDISPFIKCVLGSANFSVCMCVCVCFFFVYIYIYIIKDQYILCHCDWVCYSYMTHYHQPNINKSHQFLYQLILKKWSSDLSPFIKCVLGRCSITSNKPFGNIFSNLVVITIIFSSI